MILSVAEDAASLGNCHLSVADVVRRHDVAILLGHKRGTYTCLTAPSDGKLLHAAAAEEEEFYALFFTYQFDLDEVGGDTAVETHEHAVAIVRHKAERQLVGARVHVGVDVVDEDARPRVVHQVVTVRLYGTTTNNCVLTSLAEQVLFEVVVGFSGCLKLSTCTCSRLLENS